MTQSQRQIAGARPITVSTDDSVLVVIDAQNEYADGLLKTTNIEATRSAIKRLVDQYRSRSAPIVHVLHQTPDGAPIFTANTALYDEFAEIQPPADTSSEKVVVKNYPGSFTGTDLEAHLTALGRKKVVLVGYMAHVCVSTTARQAAERGYEVVLVREAIGDRDIPGADAATLVRVVLAELEDAFGTVIRVDEVK